MPSDIAGPGAVRLTVASLGQLQATLDQLYHQALSPPSLLQCFQTATLPFATEAEQLNPDNGLLLSALWDAAFDRGLVASFLCASRPSDLTSPDVAPSA